MYVVQRIRRAASTGAARSLPKNPKVKLTTLGRAGNALARFDVSPSMYYICNRVYIYIYIYIPIYLYIHIRKRIYTYTYRALPVSWSRELVSPIRVFGVSAPYAGGNRFGELHVVVKRRGERVSRAQNEEIAKNLSETTPAVVRTAMECQVRVKILPARFVHRSSRLSPVKTLAFRAFRTRNVERRHVHRRLPQIRTPATFCPKKAPCHLESISLIDRGES